MANAEDNTSDNLALLDVTAVNEGTVVERLRKRYNGDKIYTAIADILVSVNPFKPLSIYGLEAMKAYQTSKADNGLPPHIYGKCQDILRSMHYSSKRQCCVLTGECASGKTECLKHILQYIVNTGMLTQATLKSKLLQVQFILEAFGNAVTLHNSNSSRFATYYEVCFSPEQKLSGGKVHHYMLEQSRIVHQEKGGKNFHIFHYLLHGMDADQLMEYNLSSDFPHRYLCYDPSVAQEDNASKEVKSEKYAKLITYMEAVGFSREEILNILKCVASVLHIGNVAFASSNPQTNTAVVKDPQPVRCASALLGVSADALAAALITGTVFHKGVKVSVQKPVDAAAQGRDNLARTLYSRLFSWIVLRVNTCLKEKDEEFDRRGFGPSLGLLDVFGSERFEINGFEQLTINTANEQLAYFYNQRVFAWEQAELESEGLRSYKVPYHDNKKAVELLLNPPQGLLPLLDEECKTVHTTDAAFVKKCDSLHRKHPNYAVAQLSYPAFTIRHFSGPVTYVTLGFLKGNRDVLGACLQDCLQGSSNEFISRLFRAKISATGSLALQPERLATPSILMQKKKFKRNPTIRHKAAVVQHLAGKESHKAKGGCLMVGTQFRQSIADLMEKVLSCEVHFVRCIKPNWHQSPGQFDPELVLAQVKSLAVVPTVRIRNLGFPVWFTFDAFIQRFGIVIGLHPYVFIKDMEQTCLKMLRRLADARGWKMGKTKVFLTVWCLERLNSLLDRLVTVAFVIQKAFRRWQARRLCSRLRHLKMAEENAVKNFLDSVGKRSERTFQHISNQVMEEDAKQQLRVNEKQLWSPDGLNYKSPASSSQQKDLKDTMDGFPPLSPRPVSPQQKTSDLSMNSVADVLFSTSTPSRPGPPQSRVSDLSVASMFSVESEDFDTAAPLVWCKITLFEREHPRAEFFIDRPSIVIDGSNSSFDVTRIGLESLPPSSDAKVSKVRGCVGKGVEIVNDEQGNVWATRGSKNSIFVKGHFLSDEVIASKGALEKDATVQVFDWDAFADSVRYHCLQSKNFGPKIEDVIVSSASIYFSFVKDGEDDVSTPCWAQLDVLPALQQGKAACKYAREKRQQEKQQAINALPPILRPKTKKSRELSAVAHFQQKVRPRRYIDTFKFNRKKWARKEVALNPFLYGRKDELSEGEFRPQSPLKTQQMSNSSDPNESVDGASHVPAPDSLVDLFANLDETDGAAGKDMTSDYSVVENALETSPRRNGLREVSSKSAAEKPAKKVWAKKRFADRKAEKGKKRY